MKKLAAIGALGLLASSLFAQGLNPPSGQTKEDWEEINFEFNSSILSDGYPSLLRLADLMTQHRDYRVKITGNTDYVGSAAYNDKLALKRAETVKAFLVKYGASADQITTAGDGKRDPEVNNGTKEGRFMNRRVRLEVRDGQGRLIKEGGIGDVLDALSKKLDAMAKQQADCCDQILKRLDKLDDILAALKGLQGENDNLKAQLNDLRNQHNALRDQVNALPKPLNEQQTQNIAHNEAMGAVDEAQKRNKKFSLLGVDVGPNFGPSRQGNADFSGRGQFFSPFGGDGTHAVQAEGEYIHNSGTSNEAQFDIGLVNRWGNLQAGAFASFKYLNFNQFNNGGGLGQAAFMIDYLFNGGRIGAFGTQGFKNYAVLNSVTLAPGAYLQTYARVVDQYGVDGLVGVWGSAYLQGNLAYLNRHIPGVHSTPGGELKIVQPVSAHIALTAAGEYDPTYIAAKGNGRIMFGLEVGNYIHPKEFTKITTPVPMDVPRIRYQFGTRRVGSSPPIADAGPNQLGVAPGTITLNGSGSYDPLGLALTYQWTQIAGPTVAITNPTGAVANFPGAMGQTYSFRLTVRNTDGLTASASTTVSVNNPTSVTIAQFIANPASIQPGQSSTLTWVVQGATSVSISPGIGSVNANSGSTSVTPAQTTTYTLTATGAGGTVNQSVTVTVGATTAGNPQILRFEASPLNIAPGGQSTLSWTTSGATQVSISPNVGNVTANGSTTVQPSATTTYTLTATSADGKSVTAPVTVTVSPANIPQILTFVATPQNISPGQSTKLCWQVNGATNISITNVGSNLNPNDCATVSPSQTTTYTLTATNSTGQIQGNVTVNVGTVQILSFTANPVYSIVAGGAVTLTWATANASSVVLIGGDISPTNLNANGNFTVNPLSNETYTLTAYGPGGQTVSVSISVFVR
ncbi:MAG: OmpA family protein [Candidatus Sulfopaludibacter sp.]|nr:OmpA family protein [Candidatus Sulfopaludibacter sp.]